MPENPNKPERRPGSQVAPGQKPLYRQGQTASTHSRVPVDQATAGKVYRVRDKDSGDGNPTVWGENLSYEDAVRMKERVVGARRSKTARIEEMEPTHAVDAVLDAVAVTVDPAAKRRDELQKRRAALVAEIREIDQELFPDLVKANNKALAAAAPVARAAQQRHQAQVRKPVPVAAPPTPPPSPLTDELLEGGPAELPPDDEPTAADLSDITADVGGGPSDEDKARAAKTVEETYELEMAEAQGAYDAEVFAAEHGADQYANKPGPWPTWAQLGEFEHAAWRYYVCQGGKKPELTKTPRKPVHAMGAVP